jgi:hypothetical protein
VNKGLAAMGELGMVREITGGRRNRVFSYARYLGILGEGTEMPGREGESLSTNTGVRHI